MAKKTTTDLRGLRSRKQDHLEPKVDLAEGSLPSSTSLSTGELVGASIIGAKQKIRIDDQAFIEFRKSTSLQDIVIFNRFAELIAIPSAKKKWSDVKEASGEKHQSYITKSINRVKKKCKDLFGEQLFWDLDKNYTITPFGREFYEFTRNIENSIAAYQAKETEKGETQQINFALNSYAFYLVKKLEEISKKETKGFLIQKKLIHMKSAEVFDAVKHNQNIDIGVGESIREHTSGRQLEIIKIARGRMFAFTNYPVYENNSPISAENMRFTDTIRINDLIKIPIIIGNTRSFFDYLAILSEEVHNIKPGDLEYLSMDDLYEIVKELYDIRMVVSSIDLLMDVLFLDDNKYCMLATGEVAVVLQALAYSSSKIGRLTGISNETFSLLRQNKIYQYRIDDNNIRINKYLMRRRAHNDDARSNFEKMFWKAGHKLGSMLKS